MSYSGLKWAGLSDPGLKRGRNEDAYKMLVPPDDASQHALGALFVVADGMGGMRGGGLASASALEAVIREYYGPLVTEITGSTDPHERVQSAIEAANVHVREQAVRAGLNRIGTTLTGMVMLPDDGGILFNVGDSRVYRIRRRSVEQITHDQSFAAQQEVDNFQVTSTGRVNTTITAFLGQPFPLEPSVERIEIDQGDKFVLCTDGLWSLIDADEMAGLVQRNSADSAVRKLVGLARKRGAPDNVTAIVVFVGRRRKRRHLVPVVVALLSALGLLLAAMLLL